MSLFIKRGYVAHRTDGSESEAANGVMMIGSKHYSEKASEFENLAAHCSDSILRASYLDLARRFREMASLLGVTHGSKDDDIALAKRMVGKTTHHN